jgi:hypothetical protein
MLTKEETIKQTKQHIANVENKIELMTLLLKDRAMNHDNSKLEEPELSIFQEYTEKLKGSTYGSDEYKSFLKEMQVALDHHYKNNRHHPEHFENGVDGMNLMDLVEMLCDWKSASERHDNGDIFRSIELNTKRFNLSPQLVNILNNTAKLFLLTK